jgi:hypothetical protein
LPVGCHEDEQARCWGAEWATRGDSRSGQKLASGPEQEKKRKIKKAKEKQSGPAAGLTMSEMQKRRGWGNWAGVARAGLGAVNGIRSQELGWE